MKDKIKIIKVLNITKKFENNVFGGVENIVDTICRNFPKYQIESDILTIREKKIKKKNYNIFSSKINFEISSTPISFSYFFKFIKLVKYYDFIIFHYPWPFMDFLSLFVKKNKIIISYHADIIERNFLYYLYFPFQKIFFKRAKKIICSSSYIYENNKFLNNFKNKIEVIPYGINKINVKKIIKYKKIKYKNYFIFVGNLRGYKGILILIDIFKSLLNINLIIVGDGKLRNQVINKIRGCKNICFLGSLKEELKFFLIKNSYALILPSLDKKESFGISLVEAASLKKPIISTNLRTSISFINKNNITGYSILPNNKLELQKAILKLNNNNDLRKRFGLNAYLRFKNFFTEQKMIQGYASMIKKLL